LDESSEKAIWEEDNIRTSNLATLLGPSRHRKVIHKGEQNSNMCVSLGHLVTLLEGKFPNPCGIDFLGQHAKRKK